MRSTATIALFPPTHGAAYEAKMPGAQELSEEVICIQIGDAAVHSPARSRARWTKHEPRAHSRNGQRERTSRSAHYFAQMSTGRPGPAPVSRRSSPEARDVLLFIGSARAAALACTPPAHPHERRARRVLPAP